MSPSHSLSSRHPPSGTTSSSCGVGLASVCSDFCACALALLARIPDTPEARHIAAQARTHVPDDDYEARLDTLLDQVKDDDDARQQYVDLLELMGPLDPRTAQYRKKLTSRLF